MKINEKVFDILSQQRSDYIVMGDLNAKSTNWFATENNTNDNILESILIYNDCIVINNKQYTRHNFGGSTSSILDFVIISYRIYEVFSNFEVLEEDDMTSDDLPFRIEFKMNNANQNENDKRSNSRKKYNILKANWNEFRSSLQKSWIRNSLTLMR
jgi:hypothetical protein